MLQFKVETSISRTIAQVHSRPGIVRADCERIRTISFDDKSKTITIVGPFDPHRLACKLRCKGGKVIRDIHIVDNGGGKPPQKMAETPPAAKNGKPKNKDKPPAAEPPGPPPEPAPAPAPEMPPPSPAHQAPTGPDREIAAMVPAFVEEKQPNAKPAELEPPPMSPPRKERPMPMDFPTPMPASMPPPPVKERPPPRPPCRPLEQAAPAEYVIPTVEIPSWPAPPVGPCGCPCCAPCYQGYYEGCRCCCCGRTYAQPLPPPAGCGYRGCRTFSDEDPTAACTIM